MADKIVRLLENNPVGQTIFPVGFWLDTDTVSYNLGVNIRGGSVITKPQPGTYIDHSGTLAAPATSQQVMAANANRKDWFIQNNSADILWINFSSVAAQTQPSIKLLPNQSIGPANGFITTEAINIIGPNAGATFTAKQS